MTYGKPEHWNKVFKNLSDLDKDLDWENEWIDPFEETLKNLYASTILDLGCGTGNDSIRLAKLGYKTTGLDFSSEGISQAKRKAYELDNIDFIVADMAQPLNFNDESFDVVMSNVAMHMFPDKITRSLFSEVYRIVKNGGLFLFHLNSIDDMPLREKHHPRDFQIEDNFFQERDGQTMRFFSEKYINDLLKDWNKRRLDPVEILEYNTDEPFKRVWRGVYQKK